jgi:hypothetical protein
MVKLKGETQGERQKSWYKKRKIDQRNQAAFNAAHRAVNDAMALYLDEMDAKRFNLLDVSIVMGAVMDEVKVYMNYHIFEDMMFLDGVFPKEKRK